MQDIKKKEEENFLIKGKNTFSLKNCNFVRKTDRNFFSCGNLNLIVHIFINKHCFNYFKNVYLFTEIKFGNF